MEDGGESESFIYIVFHGENAKIWDRLWNYENIISFRVLQKLCGTKTSIFKVKSV
jgi:hypothetical protein